MGQCVSGQKQNQKNINQREAKYLETNLQSQSNKQFQTLQTIQINAFPSNKINQRNSEVLKQIDLNQPILNHIKSNLEQNKIQVSDSHKIQQKQKFSFQQINLMNKIDGIVKRSPIIMKKYMKVSEKLKKYELTKSSSINYQNHQDNTSKIGT